MKRLTGILLAAMLVSEIGAQQAPGQLFDGNQLNDMVAPIALYPDPLLSQVLVAATYPLELVEASQWLDRNPGLSGEALTQAAEQQNWDPSIQSLVVFPDLVRRLMQDINWATNLGNAFLNQQGDVMDAVQRMRARAEEAGRLGSTSQQLVSTREEGGGRYIEIAPSDPDSIYLPDYDPAYIWGPSAYYPYASWRYPRFASGVYFSFGTGIPIRSYYGNRWGGWQNWGWHPAWQRRNIVVNNTFIYRNNINVNRGPVPSGRTDWTHNFNRRQTPSRPQVSSPQVPRRLPSSQPVERNGGRQAAPSPTVNRGQGEARRAPVPQANQARPAAAAPSRPEREERRAPAPQANQARPAAAVPNRPEREAGRQQQQRRAPEREGRPAPRPNPEQKP